MSPDPTVPAPVAPVAPVAPSGSHLAPGAAPGASPANPKDAPKNALPSDKQRIDDATSRAIAYAAKGLANNAELQTLLYCCGGNVIEAKKCLSDIWSNRPGQPGYKDVAIGKPTPATAVGRLSGGPAPDPTLRPAAHAGAAGPARPMTAQEVADAAMSPNSPRFDGKPRVSYEAWEIPEAEVNKCLADNCLTPDVLAKAMAALARAWASAG